MTKAPSTPVGPLSAHSRNYLPLGLSELSLCLCV
nr:MAG TPA: hypothetical protein [Caudoviricetes sp.]